MKNRVARWMVAGGLAGFAAVGSGAWVAQPARTAQPNKTQPGKNTQPKDPPPQPGPTTPPATIPPPSTTPPASTPPTQTPQPDPKPILPTDDKPRQGMVDLRPKFKVGQQFKLKLGNVSENAMTTPTIDILDEPGQKPKPGQPTGPATPGKPSKAQEETTTNTSTTEFTLVFKTTAVSEGGEATVDVTFETIKMKLESDAMNDEFDSSKPPAPAKKPSNDPLREMSEASMLEPALRPLVGEKLTLTVDPRGNITKVEGGEKFSALFMGAGGAGGAGPSAPGAPGSTQSLFGPIFTTSKAKPQARVGDKWSTSDVFDLSIAGSVTMTTNYHLKEARAGRATIGVSGKMEPASQAKTPGTPFSIKTMTHEGAAVWNTEDGFVQSMDTSMKLETEFNLGGRTGKSTSVQKTKIERVP